MSLRNGRRLAGGPIDIDVGVASLRAGHRRALLEGRQRVANRGAPQALHFHADFDSVGVSQTREKSAIALGHKTDDRTGAGIQQAGLDEDLIHRCVEKLVIGDVVQVAVNIVVPPTRRHCDESRESGSVERRFALARAAVGSALAQPSLPENGMRIEALVSGGGGIALRFACGYRQGRRTRQASTVCRVSGGDRG
jgi:hypothetical protein